MVGQLTGQHAVLMHATNSFTAHTEPHVMWYATHTMLKWESVCIFRREAAYKCNDI